MLLDELTAETSRLNSYFEARMNPHLSSAGSPLAPPMTAGAVRSSRRRKSTNDTRLLSTRKLSTRKAKSHDANPTAKRACESRPQKAAKRRSKSKSENIATFQTEPEFAANDPPLNNSYAEKNAFWGTGPPSDDNSDNASSSQPASDPFDISKDFPKELLNSLFPFPDLSI